MKYIKLFFLLILFTNINAEVVSTGHADVSLIKVSNISDPDKNLIGIKMDMQKNWHTYWKNPGDSGGPIKVQWNTESNLKINDIQWPAPQLIPYEPLMTYGYKDFVIFPFKYTKTNKKDSLVEVNIDFLICDDICVPEKAFIKTSLSQISEDSLLLKWNQEVPSIVLPVLAKINDDFIELRFSKTNEINLINFFIENENVVNHAQKQILKEEIIGF
jgi:DsbC/DsbD-like thiol-disulfide interchange protein